jgi:hypothetical protein
MLFPVNFAEIPLKASIPMILRCVLVEQLELMEELFQEIG